MDKAAQELNKASHAVLDAELRLKTIQAQRTQLEKEIATLAFVEANLEENIRFLKNTRAIVMASEYKKATIDLATAKNRRAFLRIDRDNVLKIEKHAEANYERARAEYERAYDYIHNPPNNVLEFRKRNG